MCRTLLAKLSHPPSVLYCCLKLSHFTEERLPRPAAKMDPLHPRTSGRLLDFRSDTVTKPTGAMREAAFEVRHAVKVLSRSLGG